MFEKLAEKDDSWRHCSVVQLPFPIHLRVFQGAGNESRWYHPILEYGRMKG